MNKYRQMIYRGLQVVTYPALNIKFVLALNHNCKFLLVRTGNYIQANLFLATLKQTLQIIAHKV